MRVEIVPATKTHALHVAKHMRQADRDEVWAVSRRSPTNALMFSLKYSRMSFAGVIDGTPTVVFGVSDISDFFRIGAPWLLGTDLVEEHSKVFLRQSVAINSSFMRLYQRLENYVDARNKVSIRWLQWLGYRFDASRPVGLDQVPFHRFEMRSDHV